MHFGQTLVWSSCKAGGWRFCCSRTVPCLEIKRYCKTPSSVWRGYLQHPNRANYVTVRSSSFFTNHFLVDVLSIRSTGVIYLVTSCWFKEGIDLKNRYRCIGCQCLTDPTESTRTESMKWLGKCFLVERAEIPTRALGKDVKFVEIEPTKE